MKRIFAVAVLTLVLSACGPTPQQQAAARSLAEQSRLTTKFKSMVTAQLRDPSSAQFANFSIYPIFDGHFACGRVNARNGFGGYSGFRPFYADDFTGDKSSQIANDDKFGTVDILAVCKALIDWSKRGVYGKPMTAAQWSKFQTDAVNNMHPFEVLLGLNP